MIDDVRDQLFHDEQGVLDDLIAYLPHREQPTQATPDTDRHRDDRLEHLVETSHAISGNTVHRRMHQPLPR
ncbi:hypothetical protein [Cryptosporangium arvum]|uniref:hypothetical protein n=1 Tax=Cryptosporangium arvum TaxID=80871 RepID=UPI00056248E0|nr:hypothetical protein [Cryptosporangium arvum]